MKKFYNFISNNNNAELYLYGAITSEKWFDDDVDFKDFKNAVDSIGNNSKLNIYVNSGGGEVFVTQAIISLLNRAKATKNISIDCYIDGIGCSCASWLPMIADNLFIYNGSMLMVHKPMSIVFGNANDMRKEIELLDKIEDSEMIPMYMSKATENLTEDILRDMIANETWFTADEIEQYFNVTRLDTDKKMVASVDKELFANYKNVPSTLKNVLEDDTEEEEVVVIEDNTPTEEVKPIVEDDKPIIDDTTDREIENKIKLLDIELALL